MDTPIVPSQVRTVFEGRVFTVRVESITLPKGHLLEAEIVRHPGSVVIVPMNEANEIVLVRQYRHAIGRYTWEVPAGGLKPGEDVTAAARRECQEEVGLVAERLEPLGSFFPTPGYCNEEMHFFRAAGLREPRAGDDDAHQDEDEDIETRWVPLEELRAMIRRNEIVDLKTIAGVALAAPISIDRRAWWLVAGLWIAAFLARGPLYLSVFPPFEGWDEYQHLAYIVHLDETGAIPAYDSRVPLSLRPLVIGLPHSAPGHDQLNEWGALSYADYWDGPRAAATSQAVSSSPRLYQSQQPPLTYVLALPVWRALKGSHPLDAIFALRAINLLLVAAALMLFARALERVVPAFGPRAAVLALVCLHPLFFENVARVANDGLALATGMAGLSLLLLADGRTLLTRGLLAAVCLAASNWSKQTSLTLIPAFALGLPLIGWAHGVPAGRLWRATGVALGAFLLLIAPLWLWSYQHYGVLLMTQDSLELAARGPLAGALATSFTTMAWRPVVGTLFFPGWPWVGGWSFLRAHATLTNMYEWYWGILLAAAGAAAALAMARRARSLERTDAARLTVCAAVVIGMMLGMTYHAVLSNAVVGHATTTPWYFMTALPFLFALVIRGLAAINPRLAIACAAGLAGLFVAIELYGTWVQMPAAYANTTDTALQWRRLTAIHPAILSGRLRWWFLATQLGALCLAAGGTALAAARARRARSSGFSAA